MSFEIEEGNQSGGMDDDNDGEASTSGRAVEERLDGLREAVVRAIVTDGGEGGGAEEVTTLLASEDIGALRERSATLTQAADECRRLIGLREGYRKEIRSLRREKDLVDEEIGSLRTRIDAHHRRRTEAPQASRAGWSHPEDTVKALEAAVRSQDEYERYKMSIDAKMDSKTMEILHLVNRAAQLQGQISSLRGGEEAVPQEREQKCEEGGAELAGEVKCEPMS